MKCNIKLKHTVFGQLVEMVILSVWNWMDLWKAYRTVVLQKRDTVDKEKRKPLRVQQTSNRLIQKPEYIKHITKQVILTSVECDFQLDKQGLTGKLSAQLIFKLVFYVLLYQVIFKFQIFLLKCQERILYNKKNEKILL